MDTQEKNRIKSLIAQVKLLNDKYDTIKKLNGENFNIFSILNLESDEVKTHSYFIYNLLNPKGTHDMGDLFLKLFLKQILNKDEYKETGNCITVKREDPTDENRRIDFTIEMENLLIAIEMKIYASDQPKQLVDYKKHIDKIKKQNKLFYLTLLGSEANAESSGKLKVDKDYFLLSFYYDIYIWLQQCIEKSATVPTLREGLIHYRNLIQKLTNQSSKGIGEDMEEILKSSKDIEAANTLVNEYKNIWAKKEADFWFFLHKSLEKKLKGTGFEILYFEEDKRDNDEKIDFGLIAKERNNKNAGFGFLITKKSDVADIELSLLKWNTNNNILIGIDNVNDKYEEFFKNIGFDKKEKSFKYKFLKEKISFYGKDVSEPTFELFDKKRFDEFVESTAKEVSEIVQKIIKNEAKIVKAIKE